MAKFNIPTPKNINLPQSIKYRVGDSVEGVEQLKDHTLLFSFEYACFRKTPISLDWEKPNKSDYADFLSFLSFLSGISVKDLIDQKDEFHFHEIDIHKKYYLKTFLQRQFKREHIDYRAFPSIYQISYSSEEQAPRVCGFFGSHGVFYILWWDFNHLIYFQSAFKLSSAFKENWFEEYLN